MKFVWWLYSVQLNVLWLNKSSTRHSSLIIRRASMTYKELEKAWEWLKTVALTLSFCLTHTLIHSLPVSLSACSLSSSWPALHFDDHISIFASALIPICPIIKYSEWNSITLFSLLFRYILNLKYNMHTYRAVKFFFLLVVALDSAFGVCLWLFLYTPLLFRALLLSVAPLWPFVFFYCLVLPLQCESEGVWRQTAGVWACSQKKEGQPILTPPLRPPVHPSSAPQTPPPHPPGWKFLVCGPNSKIPNLSDLPGEQQCIDSHSCTHAH